MYLQESIIQNHSEVFNKSTGFYIFNSPMGSGKTHFIKNFIEGNLAQVPLKGRSVTIVAPYAGCRKDYKLLYDDEHNLDAKFLYPNQLVRSFTRRDGGTLCNNVVEVVKELSLWLAGLDIDWTKQVYILDEVDFFWLQCRREFTKIHTGNMHSDVLLTVVLDFIASKSLIVGFTASTVHSSCKLPKIVLIKAKGVTTTVRIKSLSIYGTRGVSDNLVFRGMLKESLSKIMPTLVYKKYYSEEDYDSMVKLADTEGKRILLVIRQENVVKSNAVGVFSKNIIKKHLTNISVTHENAQLEPTGKDFILIGADNCELDNICEGEDAFEHYDYVFINMSSSRQVSIPKKEKGRPVQILCHGSKVDVHMLQSAGRFRFNPVDVYIYLNNCTAEYGKRIGTLKAITELDVSIKSYGLVDENVQYVNAKNMKTLKAKGKAIGKAKGKAIGKALNDTTLGKRSQLSKFFKSCNLERNSNKLYLEYLVGVCKDRQFGRTAFMRRVKEHKEKFHG